MIYLSFVVDKSPKYYYQAELLLYSIARNTNIGIENIIVHCIRGVDSYFLKYIANLGIKYKIIDSYLDGRYCNKILQLNSFQSISGKGGVIFIDTDTFFLESIIIRDLDFFCAKIVDEDNPNMDTALRAYNLAKLEIPETVKVDSVDITNRTMLNNFNGGFYYIPFKYIKGISEEWKKWATFLFCQKDNVFINGKHENHIDQISMSMTLLNLNIDIHELTSNYNLPVHLPSKLRYYDEREPVRLIHYHSTSIFGIIPYIRKSPSYITKAIRRANKDLTTGFKSQFFKEYTEWRLNVGNSTVSEDISEYYTLNDMDRTVHKPRAYIHIGLPKTGTTSLQFHLYGNREFLRKQGFLYSDITDNTFAPKNQWIMRCLLSNDFTKLKHHFVKLEEEAVKFNLSLILSTEGIANHWFDFNSEAKQVFATILKRYNYSIIIYLRWPVDYIESYYRQVITNGRSNKFKCYGTYKSLENLMYNEWFERHLDYWGLLVDLSKYLGKENLVILPYKKNRVVETFAELLNLELVPAKLDSRGRNIGLSRLSILILRLLNIFDFKYRDKCIDIVRTKLDVLLKHFDVKKGIMGDELRERIIDMTYMQNAYIDDNFSFRLDNMNNNK